MGRLGPSDYFGKLGSPTQDMASHLGPWVRSCMEFHEAPGWLWGLGQTTCVRERGLSWGHLKLKSRTGLRPRG